MSPRRLALVAGLAPLLAASLACGASGDGADDTPVPEAPGPTTAPSGWPPAGPGCEALVACCDGLASDAQLFCRLSVSTPPDDCGAALDSVRRYLTERGTPAPASCAPSQAPSRASGDGPPWVEIALPGLEGWARQPAEDHGPEQGWMVDYDRDGVGRLSVFVYRGGVPSIARTEPLLTNEIRRAFAGMQQAVEAGIYQSVEPGEISMSRMGSGASAPPAAYGRATITRDGASRLSETWITTHRGFFFKVRLSYDGEVSPQARTDASRVLDAIAPAVVE